MNPNFIIPARTDLDQMPDAPTRGAHHRRAHSDTLFRFTDIDDMLLDDFMAELDIDLPRTSPSLLPPAPLPAQLTSITPPKQIAHVRSLSVDADFFDGLSFDGASQSHGAETGRGQRHMHSNSMDGYSSATSSEVEFNLKKAKPTDKLAELALVDPKKAKRILANRQSAARSKERKTRYTNELERKVQMLQNEATTLSAQITLLQKDASGLTAENNELKLKVQAIEQQARLRDALNEALRDELQWLKIAAGHVPTVNGNNKSSSPSSQFSTQFYSNHNGQQQQPFHSQNH